MSNLLEKASILTTPTAYNDGKILSVKPNTSVGDFDFTRGSSATRVNEQGLVEDVQILSSNLVQNGDFEELGSELVTNGSFDTDTDWTKDTSWTISSGKANYDAALNVQDIRQNVAFQSGKIYKISFTVSDVDELGGKQAYFALWTIANGSEHVFNYTKFNNGTYTFYYTSISGSIIYFNALNSSNGGSFSIDNVSVKQVDPNDEWSLGTGWSIANGKANSDGVSSNSNLLTISAFYSGSIPVKMTINVTDYVSGGLKVYLSSISFTEITANGNYTFYTTADRIDGRLYLKSINFIGSIDNVSVKEITDDTNLPRIDYTDGVGSWLLEPQSTNLLTYSEDFTNAIYSVKINPEYGILDPSGGTNAVRVTSSLSSQAVIRHNNYPTTIGNTYTNSIYIRRNNGSGTIIFNTVNNSPIDITSLVTSEWVRVSTTDLASFTSGYFIIILGTIGDSIEVAFPQGEQLPYATSYISTNGSTVTRLQDAAFGAGSSDLINSTEGVLYAEIAALANTSDSSKSITISDGTGTNRAAILFSSGSTNQIRIFLIAGGVLQIDVSNNVADVTDFNKVAFSYKENDFKVYINGSLVSSDTSASVWFENTISKLSFSASNQSSSFFNGNVKCVAVFKEALTDEELTCLTTI
jgi:hypothetical protein